MPTKSKWLIVSLGYALLQFSVLAIWWRIELTLIRPDPALLSPGAGTVPWLALRASIDAVVMTIMTALALPVLPEIHVREAIYVALAAVGGMWITGECGVLLFGPFATNGTQLLLRMSTYAVVAACGALLIHRHRKAAETSCIID